MPRKYGSPEEHFWAFVQKTESCWLWIGTRSLGNWKDRRPTYGQVTITTTDGRKRHINAHRLSWELFRGPIPDGLQVLHACDNPPCVNPDHLFLGTHQDNHADCAAKGRLSRGVDRYNAKVNPEIVRAMRAEHAGGAKATHLAKKYGIHRSTVADIVHRYKWKEVD